MLLLHAMLACGTSALDRPNGPLPVYRPQEVAFWSTPWPADERLDADGTLDLSIFPNPDPVRASLLTDYLEFGDSRVGYGTNSPIYLLFEGALDPRDLPTPLESTEDPQSALVLVDIDPDSPDWGTRVPVIWEQNAFPSSVYMPEHLLAVAPVHGFPLRPTTTYALLVTTRAARPHPEWTRRLQPDHPRHDPNLARALFALDIDPADIAIGTTFTTVDALGELATIADFVQRRIAPADLDAGVLEHIDDRNAYTAWRTTYASPVFTQGEAPYLLEGGGFAFDANGDPELVRFDTMRLAVCTPFDVAEPPNGWPVVIYQHGTGGQYRGFCNSNAAFEVMNRLGEVGILGLGIDQPLHGTRPGAASAGDLAHFNLLNPVSGITNFRQGAIDAIYLARSVSSRPHTFRAPDGRRFRTDPDRVMFVGHSQGGLTGALAGPFMGNDLDAMVLSGAGAVLAITVVERKDPLDFEELVRNLVDLEDEEPMTPMHPILGVIQTLVEPTDPANYAPYWHAKQGFWANHRPLQVLATSGTDDTATPFRTAIALAAAGRLPLVGAPATRVDAVDLRSGAARPYPSVLNALAFNGEPLTAGFAQYWRGSHFVVFEEQEASDLYVHYLQSVADGMGVLDPTEDLY